MIQIARMRFIIVASILLVSFLTNAQQREFELYINHQKQFLLCEISQSNSEVAGVDDLHLLDYRTLNIYDSTGATVSHYARSNSDPAHQYQQWVNFKPVEVEIIFPDFLNQHGFELCRTKVPDEEVLCEIEVLDSSEGEMLPCGNAEYPERVMNYTYSVKVSVDEKMLYEQRYTHASFSFYFDSMGEQKYLQHLTTVWKSETLCRWILITSGGFKIVPF